MSPVLYSAAWARNMHASSPTFQAPDSRNITQCGSRDIRLPPEPTAGRSTGGVPQRDRTTAFFLSALLSTWLLLAIFCIPRISLGCLAARCFPGSYHPLTISGETSWCRWQAVGLQGLNFEKKGNIITWNMQRRSGSDMIRLRGLGIQA
ncbi:hypothetical protein FVEG_05972 [Fusarium verticillioides 7600]|uniref:Uncharacterized protein n=1 Tax=Gibberella moniliformis (strain M3125 / FGSC 7600) TaxID=334819 RepID=W7MBP5_GIBM7|nr:hypothetical protein FVEG_05972 [Fusarium verticillioides 7600]EWG45030.1 hypothetical protein FVEG_05972 [Fusarium verticillioides 7600]